MDTHWQDCYGKNNSRKLLWNLDGKNYQIEHVHLFTDDTKMAGKKQRMVPVWKKFMKTLILTNQLYFLTMCIWDVLGANANRLTSLLENIQRCLNHVFLLDQLDKYQGEKSLTLKQSRGPTTWKDMLENALSDTATWQTKQWRSYTKLQVFAWRTINSNRKNLNHLENYHKFAHKLLSNVCSWNDLEDQTFCGRWTNLQEQSQNGLRHAADDRQDWFHTFITRMDSDKVVMWATLPSIVDWVYFKTQILLASLKTQNLLLGESYVSSQAEHLSQSVGCARSKRQYPTVLQNLKSFLWMLDCAWTACSRPLGHCDWSDTFNKQHRKTW